MDTSPEYIEMCRKATELREMWAPKEGDFYNREGYTSGVYSEDYFKYVVVLHDVDKWKQEVAWLPRSDQLCNMLAEILRLSEIGTMHVLFYNANILDVEYTVEQHMLRNLYKAKYEKSWNGEDWI